MEYDDRWPAQFEQVARVVRAALGNVAIAVEHVGSTSVPGLAAKPTIDVDLTVADPADEAAYVPALERAGFTLVKNLNYGNTSARQSPLSARIGLNLAF